MVDSAKARPKKKVTFDKALGNKGLEEPECRICSYQQDDLGYADTLFDSLKNLIKEKRNFCVFLLVFLFIGYLLAKLNTLFE